MASLFRAHSQGILLCTLAISTLHGDQVDSASCAYYLLSENGEIKFSNDKFT